MTEPCEHVVRLLRAVQDGKAACPRCRIFAEKIAGKLTVKNPADRSRPVEDLPIAEAAKPLTYNLSELMRTND